MVSDLALPSQGIFISRIADGGAAHREGTLQVGDRVILVREKAGVGGGGSLLDALAEPKSSFSSPPPCVGPIPSPAPQP